MFGTRFARRMAKRYRRRGLDDAASRMVAFLEAREGGLAGATVLEIGGGVGEVGVELLRRGAASVTNVELSPAYDDEAMRLAGEAGVADRVRRHIADVAAAPDTVESADLVVLHRVVCCYPDYESLLGVAADRCRERLAFSHPPRNAFSRAVTTGDNLLYRLIGRNFRTFAHPPAAMVEVVTRRGFRTELQHRGLVWHAQGLVR